MTDTKLTALAALTSPALTDQVYIVDASDTTDDAAGSSKRILLSDLIKAIGGKVPLQTITLASAGEFDFDSIPGTYKRLIIQGTLRGSVSATIDDVDIIFNEDTTQTNYQEQAAGGLNGSAFAGKAASSSRIAYPPAGTAPADSYSPVTIVVEDYAGSKTKSAQSTTHTYYGTGTAGLLLFAVQSSITAAITRIRIRTDNHPTDGLIGTLTLYGEL